MRVAEALARRGRTVGNVSRRFVLEALEAAIVRGRRKSPSRERKLDGEGEARLVAVARSAPPTAATAGLRDSSPASL